jgi:hypothetical protein
MQYFSSAQDKSNSRPEAQADHPCFPAEKCELGKIYPHFKVIPMSPGTPPGKSRIWTLSL